MKLLTLLIALCAIFTFCTISCSKDSGNKSPSERITGVWKLDKIIDHERVSGIDNSDTIIGTADDKVDFRTDGKVYSYVQGSYDTVTYSVNSETKITIDSQPYDIQTLTDNALTLYYKEEFGSDYAEETDYFVR